MSKAYRLPNQDAISPLSAHKGLPTDRPVAVYYRQSSEKQIGNVSTAIQTVDMVDHLERQGWNRDDIYLIDMDAGVSGTKRIDERPGMKRLFELVTERAVGAIACQDEDRLFRDVTQIQVNIFIESCRASGVLVVTPSMVYDFAHPQYGTFHARQFRFKSEMAAEYLTSFVIGQLHRARMRMALEGRWIGASVPPGYIVDMRKQLPDGSANENWRRLVPFDPFADVVRGYFRVFLECSGNLDRTLRQIIAERLFYPEPTACPPPEGFKVRYGFKWRNDGYRPGRTGLRHLLTNAAYIGHWCVNDAVVRWNNHPAIVLDQDFYRAFNYLSPQALDGSQNPSYRPFRENSRPTKEEDRQEERPIYAGMILGEAKGMWKRVGTEYVARDKHYRYMLMASEDLKEYMWSKHAGWIDEAISKLLLAKLHATFSEETWEKSLADFPDDFSRERKLKASQLAALDQAMSNLVAGLERLTSDDLIHAVEKRYEEARLERARLETELARIDEAASQSKFLHHLKDTYEGAIDSWGSMTRNEKRTVAQAFIDRIEAIPYEKHGLHFDIYWRDNSSDRASVPRLPTVGQGWSLDEHVMLTRLLDSGATQLEIVKSFPDRTWRTIRDRIARTRGMSAAVFTPKPVRDLERIDDYERRIADDPESDLKARTQWRREEIDRLVSLLDSGATKMDIARSFPSRKWTRLRAKISELRGSDFEVPGNLELSYKQSYAMKLAENECSTSNDVASNMESENPSTTIARGSRKSASKARKPARAGSPCCANARPTAPRSTTSTCAKSPRMMTQRSSCCCRTPASSATGSRFRRRSRTRAHF